MTKFSKCQALFCDRTAKKWVKLYLENYESKMGGWNNYSKMIDTARGIAVLKTKKAHKIRVCQSCYDASDIEDFSPFIDFDGEEKVISRIIRL